MYSKMHTNPLEQSSKNKNCSINATKNCSSYFFSNHKLSLITMHYCI